MVGEYDPVTPPQFAQEAAETLSNSSIAVLPRGGHSPSGSSPCLVNIATRFLANPAQPPDRSCLAAEGPIPFFVPQDNLIPDGRRASGVARNPARFTQ